jgi:predicted metal-binding protein
MTTEILVCVLCRPPKSPREQPRPGRALLEAIENVALRDDRVFAVRPVDCMSGCCVAQQAPGKATRFFQRPAGRRDQRRAGAGLRRAAPG